MRTFCVFQKLYFTRQSVIIYCKLLKLIVLKKEASFILCYK